MKEGKGESGSEEEVNGETETKNEEEEARFWRGDGKRGIRVKGEREEG